MTLIQGDGDRTTKGNKECRKPSAGVPTDEIRNESTVAGATATDALNALGAAISTVPYVELVAGVPKATFTLVHPYTPGAHQIRVTKQGIRQILENTVPDFTEDDATHITMNPALDPGEWILVEYSF